MCSQTLPIVLSRHRKIFLRIFWLVCLVLSFIQEGCEYYDFFSGTPAIQSMDIWLISMGFVPVLIVFIISLRFIETRSIIGYDAHTFRVQNTFTIFSDYAVTISWQSHLEKVKLTDGVAGFCCLWVLAFSMFSLIPLKSIDDRGNPYYFFVPRHKYIKDFVAVEKQLKSIPNAGKLLEVISG